MHVRPIHFWGFVTAAALITFGIVLNPWLRTPDDQWTFFLQSEALVGMVWLMVETRRAARRSSNVEKKEIHDAPVTPLSRPDRSTTVRWANLACFLFVVVAWLFLYREHWRQPRVIGDDAHYLATARESDFNGRYLLTPYNEHMVVPTRVLTYLLAHTGDDSSLAARMAWSTIPLFVLALGQLFLLARREWRSDFAGLLAVVVFSLTTVYGEIITWYSATQWLFALNLLLAALALTSGRSEAPSKWRVTLASLLALIAPFSYSIGVLVGPLVSAWLTTRAWCGVGRWDRRLRIVLPTLATLVGAAATLAILLPWMATGEYSQSGGRGVGALRLGRGILYVLQLSVDHLIVGNFGGGAVGDDWRYALLFAAPVIGLVAMLRWVPGAWRLWPMVAMIVLPLAITIPFRAYLVYVRLLEWTRYLLVPQLGVALLVTGTVALLRERRGAAGTGSLTWRQGAAILLLTTVLTWLHANRS